VKYYNVILLKTNKLNNLTHRGLLQSITSCLYV